MKTQLAAATETRREKRHTITQTIIAYDTMTSQELGSLANLTSDGMMLVSKQEIESNRIYQVSLQLPFSIDGNECIDIVVDCLWSKPADSHELFWAGCAIIDADKQAAAAIDTLIESYSE